MNNFFLKAPVVDIIYIAMKSGHQASYIGSLGCYGLNLWETVGKKCFLS